MTTSKRIVGFGVCGGGEASRYLENTLKEFKRLCDDTLIVCNNCKQEEFDLIKRYGFKILIDNREWGKEQWRIKEEAVKKHIKADWVVVLDMDETFDKNFTREELEKLCNKGGAGYYFYIVNLYNKGYSKKWSFFNIRLFNTEYGLNWERKALHCGLAPRVSYEWGNYAPFILKHYGLKEEADRSRKVERYRKYDPNKKFKSGNYYNFLASIEKEQPFDEDELHKLVAEEVKNYKHKLPNKNNIMTKERKYFFVKNKQGRIIDIPAEALDETLRHNPEFELMSKDPVTVGGSGVQTTEAVADVPPAVEFDVSDSVEIKDIQEDTQTAPENTENVEEDTIQEEEVKDALDEDTEPLNAFECDVCGFIAKTTAGLKAHKRKHTV
jgi:hypothetical protein